MQSKRLLCLGNISGDFSAKNVKKKRKKKRLNRYVYNFSVDYRDTSDNTDIHKYLMKKHDIKQCLKLF